MSVYYGSKWFAIMGDPKTSRVEQMDVAPDPDDVSQHRLFCPEPATEDTVAPFDTEAEAVFAVREHILSTTRSTMIELVCAIEHIRANIEEFRILESNAPANKERCQRWKADIDEMTVKLKALRTLRRAKVRLR